jgi:hypothetical protein
MIKTITLVVSCVLVGVIAGCGPRDAIIPPVDDTPPNVTLTVVYGGETITVNQDSEPPIGRTSRSTSATFLASVTDSGGAAAIRVVAAFGQISDVMPTEATVETVGGRQVAVLGGDSASPVRSLAVSGTITIDDAVTVEAVGLDYGGSSGTSNVSVTPQIALSVLRAGFAP